MKQEIPGYPGYAATKSGKIFRKDDVTGKWVEAHTTISKAGYKQMYIKGDDYKGTALVHRLIWLAFKGEVPKVIHHKNRDRLDNRLSNIQNGSYKDNSQAALKHGTFPVGEKSGKCKISEKDVARIKFLAANDFTYEQIARALQISRSQVGAIVIGAQRKYDSKVPAAIQAKIDKKIRPRKTAATC